METERSELINKALANPGKRVKQYFGYFYSPDGVKIYDITKRFGTMWCTSEAIMDVTLKGVIKEIESNNS